MRRLASFLFVFLYIAVNHFAQAGSEIYLGVDAVRHRLETTTATYSSINPPSFGEATDTYTDWGMRLGYKHKNRLTDRYFWAPELAVASFDGNDLLYSTNLRLGYEFAPLELYATFGVSHIDKFTDNRLNYGLGLEYRLTNQASLNLEWSDFDDITETTSSTEISGPITVDVQTDTVRNIQSLKLGFTYYFQGSI